MRTAAKLLVMVSCIVILLTRIAHADEGVMPPPKRDYHLDLQTYDVGDGQTLTYTKLDFKGYWDRFWDGPRLFFKLGFTKESIPYHIAIWTSSAILIYYDQDITDETRRFAKKRLGLPQNDRSKVVANIGGFPLAFPTDLSSSMYFIGDGFIHIPMPIILLSYGHIKNDYRAFDTGFQLVEGLALVAASTQILKHATGRESPFTTNVRGGVWRFFPNQIDYHHQVAHYDAFPSGHLATTMATTTVLANNYPEYRFIKPVGYSLMVLLGFEMVNNGVHWAGDYPLALGIGWLSAEVARQHGQIRKENATATNPGRHRIFGDTIILPIFNRDQVGVTFTAALW